MPKGTKKIDWKDYSAVATQGSKYIHASKEYDSVSMTGSFKTKCNRTLRYCNLIDFKNSWEAPRAIRSKALCPDCGSADEMYACLATSAGAKIVAETIRQNNYTVVNTLWIDTRYSSGYQEAMRKQGVTDKAEAVIMSIDDSIYKQMARWHRDQHELVMPACSDTHEFEHKGIDWVVQFVPNAVVTYQVKILNGPEHFELLNRKDL